MIAIDQDGTLLSDDGSISERNVRAVKTAVSRNIQVIIATGKTRGSAVNVMAQLGIETPGVFTQGLVICNADGSIRYEQTLDRETAVTIFAFCDENQLPYSAYCGMRIIAPHANTYADLLRDKYLEPFVEVVGPLAALRDTHRINKIVISDEENNDSTRAQLEILVGHQVTVTQAVPEYIEIIPTGASKGLGVKRLLTDLGYVPSDLLAIGDGENDLEMLQMAGVGVAMGNAATAVKAIADYVTADNNHSGVAEAIERFAL